MTVVKNVLNRIHVQRLLLAAALSCLSLSASAAGFPGFMAKVTGKNTTIGTASNGTPVVTTGAGLTAGGGWQNAGNYGVAQGASGAVKVGGKATVPVNGKNVPVEVTGSITKADIAGAIVGCMTRTIIGCAIGVAPIAVTLLSGDSRVSPTNPDQLEMKDPTVCTVAPCYDYKGPYDPNYYPTPETACRAVVAGANVGLSAPFFVLVSINSNASTFDCIGARGTQTGYNWTLSRRSIAPKSPTWYPATPQEVKDALYKKDIPVEVVPELEKAGAGPALPIGNIGLTGPATITSSTTNTTNNIDNSVTSSTTTNNYNYNGDTVTNTGQTVKTDTTKADGTKTQSTTSTVTPGDQQGPADDEQQVQCDKYPNSLGCAELDTPDADIPKDTKNVTFAAEDPFGGGRCPADVMASFRAIGGQSLKIVDWATFCGQAVPLRGLVLALASIMAFFIIMPGGVRE